MKDGESVHATEIMISVFISSMILIFAVACIIPSEATSWSSKVQTASNMWSIQRQSQNLSFDYTENVRGKISAVDFHGRSLRPYHSSYQTMRENDVILMGRTSASEGNFSSTENILLRSDTSEEVTASFFKEKGSQYFAVNYFESWPVIIKSSRRTEYAGKNINEMSLAGNGHDYASSNLLYNKKLSFMERTGLLQTRLNATVIGMLLPDNTRSNETLVSARLKPNHETVHMILVNSTGIADLKYCLSDYNYDFKRSLYPMAGAGEDRFIGNFSIFRRINERSVYENESFEGAEISCDFAGNATST